MTELPPGTAVPVWPAGVTTYPTKIDDLEPTETIGAYSKEINDITAAVEAIEATLGTSPAGSYPSVKAALSAVVTQLAAVQNEIQNIVAIPGPPNTYFKYNHPTPGDVWDIVHNLGRKVAITVTDSAGTPVEGEVDYVSDNRLIITFSAPFAGEATLS